MKTKTSWTSRTLLLVVALLVATAAQAEKSTVIERLQPSPECLQTLDGEFLYGELCASCHGATGLGDGPAADLFDRPPADLTRLAADNDGQYPSLRVRQAVSGQHRETPGGRDMSGWERILGCEIGDQVGMRLRVYNLVKYVEEIQAGRSIRKGSAIASETKVVRIDPWLLLQSSGDELYQHMCASCHGDQGAGGLTVLTPEPIHPPALDHLKQLGIPRDHWVYVLESPCEDAVHKRSHGAETMPCWQRIFRLALGNDAAPILVSNRLASYLDSIQVEE